ncbi:MAG: toxin-antitoxin system HicB family antitoxin [bacterium]
MSKNIQIRITDQMHEKITEIAKNSGVTLNDYIKFLMAQKLEDYYQRPYKEIEDQERLIDVIRNDK